MKISPEHDKGICSHNVGARIQESEGQEPEGQEPGARRLSLGTLPGRDTYRVRSFTMRGGRVVSRGEEVVARETPCPDAAPPSPSPSPPSRRCSLVALTLPCLTPRREDMSPDRQGQGDLLRSAWPYRESYMLYWPLQAPVPYCICITHLEIEWSGNIG